MENFSFEYPGGWWIVVFVVALGLSALLYWRSTKWQGNAKWVRPLLWTIRFLLLGLIGLLLLGPIFTSIQEESKDPRIVVLMDGSQSISSWCDQIDIRPDTWVGQIKDGLSEAYEVDVFEVGDAIRSITSTDSIAFDDPITNLSEPLEYISDIYEGENLGGVVLLSDGIFNQGKSPIYAKINSTSPVYTVALGDTTRQKDIILKRVLSNEVAYLDDQMSTQVDIQAYNANAERISLTVERYDDGIWTSVTTRDISLRGTNSYESISVDLDMDRVGVIRYRYRVSPLNQERNRVNNVKDIYIEVLDARQEIGIIALAPHPDLTALKQLLEQNKNYQVEIYLDKPSASEMDGLDLVIFHSLPSADVNINDLISRLDQQQKPRMYIISERTSLSALSSLQSAVTVRASTSKANQVQARVEEGFKNFELSDELIQRIPDFPPIAAPFGEYDITANVQTLLSQTVGKIETEYPLLSFVDDGGQKTAFLFGTGFWRWKLFDYVQHGNFDMVSELLDRTMVYTSVKEDKRKFRVSASDNVFLSNESITFAAELYNDSYELVNDPDVQLVITDRDGGEFDYIFSRTTRSYALDLGSLTPGRYTYLASTMYDGEAFEARGEFTVQAIQYELYELQARHDVLYALAAQRGGERYYPNQIDQLIEQIKTSDVIKPVLYQSSVTELLLNRSWLLWLLLGLLVVEWFLRRYFGGL
ncbi:MAG: hypothetical protein AAFQ02_00680 [Bacteroidota bacterium]